jgi:hypothetical protein
MSTGSLPHLLGDIRSSAHRRCQHSVVLKTGQWNSACPASMVWSWRHVDADGAEIVCWMMQDPTRQQQQSTILPFSAGSAWTTPPTVPTWCPVTSTSSLLWRGHSKGAVSPMKTLKHPYGHLFILRTPTFNNRGSSSSWSGGTNVLMLMGTMLKNSQQMSRSAHIGVYLVHAISCRWWTRETYFATVPHIRSFCTSSAFFIISVGHCFP